MIVLHIGAPKTGSTAIQDFLSAARADLLELGILVPETGWRDGAGHSEFRRSMNKTSDGDLDMERVRAEMNQHFDWPGHVLISCEMIWSVPPKGAFRYYPKLKDATIVFYMREQVSMIESHYSQKLKGGRECRSFREFFEAEKEAYDYIEMFQRWQTALDEGQGEVKPFLYSQNMNVIEDFLSSVGSIFGVSPAEIDALCQKHTNRLNFRANVRKTYLDYALLLLVNRSTLPDAAVTSLREQILRKSIAMDDLDHITGSFAAPDVQKDIRDYYAESNDRLRKLLFPASRRKLFSRTA